MPNSAPAGTNLTRTIPRSYALHKSDFGFTDIDGNAFKAVLFTTLPGAGTLYYDSNGSLGGGRTAVVAGQTISAADILAGKLTYVAPAGVSGANYDHFTFQVQDGGGTAGGGVDTDQSPNTLTFDLVATAATPSAFGSLVDLSNLSAADGFKVQGDRTGDGAGRSVSSAGDVNGDGFDDIIIGALYNDGGGYDAGAAYVIFGKAGGFGSLIDLTGLSSANGFKIQGDSEYNQAGVSVSSAGDVNGDGFDDILVGAHCNSSGGYAAGAAYVIFGKSGDFGTLIDLTGLSANDGFKIQGEADHDYAGFSVSSAGDVNGDGFADIIVGARANDGGGYAAGAAYVIFGKSGGFGSLLDLASLSPTDGFRIKGEQTGDQAGFDVSSAGDVNGDGFADILVGAWSNDGGGDNAGAAYVIFGKASGFAGLVALGTLAASDGFKIQGDLIRDYAGGSVSSAGDVNGDGFADLVIGATGNDSGAAGAGAAYVIFGKSGGFGNLIDLTGLSAADGFKIQGEGLYDQAGYSVSSAGDVNGDGFADIIVGAIGNGSGGINAGAAYVIFGKSGGFGTLIDLVGLSAADGIKIQGDVAHDFAGWSVSSAGDVNGDGFADILVGARYNDSGGSNAGAAYVIFGRANTSGTAVSDSASVAENATVVINVLANDSDPGNALAVAKIDGHNIAVGTPVTLASGAIVSLNNDGTLTYNPNHAFDATPGAGSGASNTSAPDSFTYTLAGGGTATVSVTINGIDSNDVLIGTAGADVLNGGIGSDYLLGLGGDDTLNGNAGAASTLQGGTGDDYYYVNFGGDSVLEAAGEGNDRVVASVSSTLSAGQSVETMTTANQAATTALNLTGNELAQVIFGNAGANILTGGGGGDYLIGLGGDDILVGNATTSSTLQGGTGNDWYYIARTGESIIEFAGEGNDRILTSADFTLSAGQEIETLSTADALQTTAINLTGNALAQVIYGNAGANTLTGGGGADYLLGFGGDDILFGNSDAASTLQGGTGNDWYYVTRTGDSIIEFAGEGNDRILTSVSYTLSAGQEIETLAAASPSGTSAIDLAGNGFAQFILGTNGTNILNGDGGADTLSGLAGSDVLLGGDGDDQLNGGAGSDGLNGGNGADLFVFADALGAGNVDAVQDFASGVDRLLVDHNVFTGLASGALPASAFVTGTGAQDADDRIIYNPATGELWFDADGNGAGAAILFATLSGQPGLTANDFSVI